MSRYEALHAKALDLCRRYKQLEGEIILALQEIDRSKAYRHYLMPSLFQYCVQMLGLSESVAYAFILVARKSLEVPELGVAISDGSLTVAKASRFVPKLNRRNAKEMIQFARTHSTREIEQHLTPDQMVSLKIKRSTMAKLKRAQAVVPGNRGLDEVLNRALTEFLEKADPVERAKRHETEKAKATGGVKAMRVKELRTFGVAKGIHAMRMGSSRLSAATKHAVNLRDKGRCTFILPGGKRCANERWLEIHHIRPRSEGGSDEISNLTTLCSEHHDLVHQLSLPLEGQVSWLRQRTRGYLT